jgi:SNF2 family DNA or RNA helicase
MTPSVVFSFWTYSLDLVERMLDIYAIAYTRIDGKTPLPKRLRAMEDFQKNDLLRVILVSIMCGGAG